MAISACDCVLLCYSDKVINSLLLDTYCAELGLFVCQFPFGRVCLAFASSVCHRGLTPSLRWLSLLHEAACSLRVFLRLNLRLPQVVSPRLLFFFLPMPCHAAIASQKNTFVYAAGSPVAGSVHSLNMLAYSFVDTYARTPASLTLGFGLASDSLAPH